MAKMRTILEAYEAIKASDNDTALTLSGIRRLVNTGKVPSVKIGRRILINYDALTDYLNNPADTAPLLGIEGKIRKVI